jgi:hypothetical protein
MRADDVWDDCVTFLSFSCHEIGAGRRRELYLAHILGHYLCVVVNAWCNSFSRYIWVYNIECTKMVLLCFDGSSKPEKIYLGLAFSSRREKRFHVYYCSSWDCGMILIHGCHSLLAGIS